MDVESIHIRHSKDQVQTLILRTEWILHCHRLRIGIIDLLYTSPRAGFTWQFLRHCELLLVHL